MNIVWMLVASLLRDCVGDITLAGNLGRSAESPRWVDRLIEHIGRNTSSRQVALMTNFCGSDSEPASPIIDELFEKIAKKFATLRINIADSATMRSPISNFGIDDDRLVDLSTTFFILVHDSRGTLNFLPPQRTVEALLKISAFKRGSQFLLIVVSHRSTANAEEFLRHAWNHQLLDLTVFEVVGTSAPIVHQFDPFQNTYTRAMWTPETEWFPDKVLDMRGYPMKIGVTNRPPFSLARFNEFSEPTMVAGANIEFLKIIGRKLNFTLKYINDVSKMHEFSNEKDAIGITRLMASGKVDVMAYLSPHYMEGMKNTSLRTTTVRLNRLCTVVPLLPMLKMPFSLDFFRAYLAYFGIVAVFWLVSRVLRFQSRPWYPFNIGRTLLGISAGWNPKRSPERALYACLLAVSAVFASDIYAAITGVSLKTNAVQEFKSFGDLDRSRLTPQINLYLFEKTFGHSVDTLMSLKNKTIPIDGGLLPECPNLAARDKNVSCLLLSDEAATAVRSSVHRGRPKLKFTEPCFWTDSTAFLLGTGSPYRSRINDVISMLKDTGIVEKIYGQAMHTLRHNQIGTVGDDDNDSGLNARQNMRDLRRQLYALAIVGYAISTLALVGEIVVHWVRNFRSLKQLKVAENATRRVTRKNCNEAE